MRRTILGICIACCIQGLSGQVVAQEPDFTALVPVSACTDLAFAGDRVFGALPGGGLLVWNVSDPSVCDQWTSTTGLVGNKLLDIDFSGRYLWAAAEDVGLTRIDVSGEEPVCRHYSSSLSSPKVTAVAGTLVGETEIVLYGTDGSGVGVIYNGREGESYNAPDHGLIDDTINCIVRFQDAWWIGTPTGVSRFANNVFSDRLAGLVSTTVRVLYAAGDTALYVGTTGGRVCRWDSDTESWDSFPVLPLSWINELVVSEDGLMVLSGPVATPDFDVLVAGAWESRELPLTDTRALLYTTDCLWAGCGYRDEGMSDAFNRPALARLDGSSWTTWHCDGLLPTFVGGVDIAPDGRLWLGDYRGLGVSSLGAEGWFHIFATATAENNYEGHFGGGNVIALAAAPTGEIWFNQLAYGVVRFTPAGVGGAEFDSYDLLTAATTGLTTNYLASILVHPDGPVLFLSANDNAVLAWGVDVLLDGDSWEDSGQWIRLPTGAGGLHGGYIRGGVVERKDVIWFIVEGVGLVRWDINGEFVGPNGELTWDNQVDDMWDAPLTSITGAGLDLGSSRAMTVAGDGTFWVGGTGGVVHFSYDEMFNTAQRIDSFSARVSSIGEGLLSNEVVGIALDRNGDIWVACEDRGLNRIHYDGDDAQIDAYMDVETFLDSSVNIIYSPRVLRGLPGGSINSLVAGSDGTRLLVGSNNGALIVDVPAASAGGDQPLAGLALYPNPFQPERGRLFLGGINTEVTYSGYDAYGGAAVEIFNLEGQIVYRDNHVSADEAFWDGNNMFGSPAVTGMYLVKVVLGGQTKVCSLAVVR